jgi:hypothetical protein
MKIAHLVIPAQAGIQFSWMPAFAGMTADDCPRLLLSGAIF